jgi:hypothetical protein
MLDHDKAMKLWKSLWGNSQDGLDYKKRPIKKAAYGDHDSKFGWDVHHKVPKSQGGTDAFDNLTIVHVITHDEIHGRA